MKKFLLFWGEKRERIENIFIEREEKDRNTVLTFRAQEWCPLLPFNLKMVVIISGLTVFRTISVYTLMILLLCPKMSTVHLLSKPSMIDWS